MKYAVFPSMGLGDGLIALVLSHNLVQSGHKVDTFHPFMTSMQALFPKTPLKPRPEGLDFLKQYDRYILIYEKSEWMLKVLIHLEKHSPEKLTVLNPIATPNQDYPYWEVGRFDGNFPFVDNLVNYCKNILQLKVATKDNGLVLPDSVKPKKYPKRVILHPTSSRAGKNWSKAKFLQLAERLKKESYEPVFILTKEEKKDWPEVETPHFENLRELTYFIAESGSMIGNDSGIGHLASNLGLPTLTICRNTLAANFWRPAFSQNEVIVPPTWIPNIKGMRLRDKKWQHFVPVSSVLKPFLKQFS